jgi:hypothetical protein
MILIEATKSNKEWAEQYRDCNYCKYLGTVNIKDQEYLCFDSNDVQLVADITSIDGKYYKVTLKN